MKDFDSLANYVWDFVVDSSEIDNNHFSHSADAYDQGVSDALDLVKKFLSGQWGQ